MSTKTCLIIVLALAFLAPAAMSPADDEMGIRPGKPDAPAFTLTQAEKDWLARHPVIRVGGPKAFPPFHHYDENGEAKGIGPEYIHLILRQLGVKPEYAPALPWPQVLKKTQDRELDLIACAAKSADREPYLSFSDPYLSYPMVIITQRNAPFVGGLNDLHSRKIALIKKVVTVEWLKRDGVVFESHLVDQPLDALQAVSMGRAFAAIDNLASASYLIQKNGLLNLKIAAPTAWGNYQLYFAVRKDWPQLTSIMNKVLASLNKAELSAIRNKWITVRFEHGLSTTDILKWAAIILVPALIIVLFFFVHNRRLRMEVFNRKKEVHERKKAEEELARTVEKLETALAEIRQLGGLLPICSSCKKIRDDRGYWQQVEEYITVHSEVEFTHSICPDCIKKLYPQLSHKAEASGGSSKAPSSKPRPGST